MENMEQKIATPEELERLRQYIKDIVDEYALNSNDDKEGFYWNFNRLWGKSEGRLLFTRKHPNPEKLTFQEKEEWEKNRIENVKLIGALIKDLISEYQQEYDMEINKTRKTKIMWVINALQEDYDLYFGHIIGSYNESKVNLKNIIKESINAVFKRKY